MSRPSRIISIAVLTGATALLAVFVGKGAAAQSATPTSAVKNCSDFKTQPEAQQYFTSHGGSKSNNFDNLDPNRNGIACEGLPGTPTSASPTPVPVPTTTAKPLPSNGIFSMILAMSGLSLVEAGIGLSLLSDRIKSRGGRVPLAVLKLLAKATRQGRSEIALSDDVYIVRRTSAETQKTTPVPDVRVAREPVAVLAQPAIIPAPAADEWSATLALEDLGRGDSDDWPYFTPPEA